MTNTIRDSAEGGRRESVRAPDATPEDVVAARLYDLLALAALAPVPTVSDGLPRAPITYRDAPFGGVAAVALLPGGTGGLSEVLAGDRLAELLRGLRRGLFFRRQRSCFFVDLGGPARSGVIRLNHDL